MNLHKNKESVYQQVAQATQSANRPEGSVQIIAVTKYVDSEVTRELVEAGISHIGENRVDKFLAKREALKDKELTWHLIGSLQRRKVKDVINQVDYFHALDSVSLAAEIQKRANHSIKCFLQVNISEEESKHGFKVHEIDAALDAIAKFDKIELVGLMTMAPFEASRDELNHIFRETYLLGQQLAKDGRERMSFTEYSMGMSGDYDIAISNGATFVRIGSSFFN